MQKECTKSQGRENWLFLKATTIFANAVSVPYFVGIDKITFHDSELTIHIC
jgi:hypothetical protein